MPYYYESHMGGIYSSNVLYNSTDLYCTHCGDSDQYLGYFKNDEDFVKNYVYSSQSHINYYDIDGIDYAKAVITQLGEDFDLSSDCINQLIKDVEEKIKNTVKKEEHNFKIADTVPDILTLITAIFDRTYQNDTIKKLKWNNEKLQEITNKGIELNLIYIHPYSKALELTESGCDYYSERTEK